MAMLEWQRESFGCTEDRVLNGDELKMGAEEPREMLI